MSVEQNKAVARRWVEAHRPGNLSELEQLADECYTADYVLHDPDWSAPPGPEGAKLLARGVLEKWPDVHVSIEDLVAEGDRVAIRVTVNSTDAATGSQRAS